VPILSIEKFFADNVFKEYSPSNDIRYGFYIDNGHFKFKFGPAKAGTGRGGDYKTCRRPKLIKKKTNCCNAGF
jgi:hypothetical protein